MSKVSFWNPLAENPHRSQDRTLHNKALPFLVSRDVCYWFGRKTCCCSISQTCLGPKPEWEKHMQQHARGIKSQKSRFVWTGRLSSLTGVQDIQATLHFKMELLGKYIRQLEHESVQGSCMIRGREVSWSVCQNSEGTLEPLSRHQWFNQTVVAQETLETKREDKKFISESCTHQQEIWYGRK